MPRISLSSTLVCGLAACTIAACDKKKASDGDPPTRASAALSTGSPATPPVPSGERGAGSAPPATAKLDVINDIRVRSKEITSLKLDWKLPPGTALNDEAPFRVRWDSSEGLTEAPSDLKSTGSAVKNGLMLTVKTMPSVPRATLDGELNLVVCDATNHSICLPVKRNLQLGFLVAADAPAQASVAIQLPPAK
jgi:hypothetical protein